MKFIDETLALFTPTASQTEQQTKDQIYSIVTGLLQLTDTDCKMTADDHFYVYNDRMHYYVLITPDLTKVTNSKMHYVTQHGYDWYKKTKKPIIKWIDEKQKLFEAKIFESEIGMLTSIATAIERDVSRKKK